MDFSDNQVSIGQLNAANNVQAPPKVEQVDVTGQVSDDTLNLLQKVAVEVKDQKRAIATELDLLLGILGQHAEIDSLITTLDKKGIMEKSIAVFGDQINEPFKGRVVFCPQVKEALILTSVKKGSGYFTDLDLLAGCFSMPRIVALSKDSPALQSVFDNQKKTNLSVQTAQSLSCKSLSYPVVEEKVLAMFSQANEQIARALSTKGVLGVFLTGSRGAEMQATAESAVMSMRRNLTDYKFHKTLVLDLKSVMDSGGNVGEETRKLIEDVRLNSPAVIIATNFDRTGEEWLTAIALIREVRELTNAQIVVLAEQDFYKLTVGNSSEGTDFALVKIGDLDRAQVLTIVGNKLTEIKLAGIGAEVGLSERIYEIARRYITNEGFPGKAVKLVDEIFAEAKLRGMKTLTEDLMLTVVSQKTGLPLEKLSQSEKDVLIGLEEELASRVAGQDEAIRAVAGAIKRARSGLKDPKKPIGSFIFLGPTGVGKTELAKSLHGVFFGDDKSFLRLDMSEFSEQHTVMRLTGSPPGYVGYEEGGQLTNFVLENPYSMVLFDEIEKAHPKVYDLFLQILDEGRLTDAKGNLVDFRNTIIIFTSNAGAQEIYDTLISDPKADRNRLYEEKVLPKLKQIFRLEFINRFDSLVMFNPLSNEVFGKIVRMKIKSLTNLLAEKKIGLEITEEGLMSFVAKNADPKFGARSIERGIKSDIETPISELIISNKVGPGQVVVWSPDKIEIKYANT